jgi:hypothetical protein
MFINLSKETLKHMSLKIILSCHALEYSESLGENSLAFFTISMIISGYYSRPGNSFSLEGQ